VLTYLGVKMFTKMLKRFTTGALLLLVAGVALASPNTGVSSSATGYWRTSVVPGFEFHLVSGRYYIGAYDLPTCGMVLRIDAAVPKTFPNESIYGRAQWINPNGDPIPYGTTVNLLKPSKPGLVGTIRVDAYDAVTDTLTVTVTSSGGGPNGTFYMYRNPIAPFTVSMPPC